MAAIWIRYKTIILYGSSLAVLMFLVNWLELRFMVLDHAMDVYIAAIALLFTGLGIWLALKLAAPKVQTVVVEKEIMVPTPVLVNDFVFNDAEFRKLGMSNRELEVLQLMAKGLSNQEIADQLFVSQNTVKTHCSNLFEKLDAKRRTQAIEKARQLGIIPATLG